MIYLIEDKTSRRNDYGWTNEKISTKSDIITVIENAAELIKMMPEILMDGNVVLFHESFSRIETNDKVKMEQVEDKIVISKIKREEISLAEEFEKYEGANLAKDFSWDDPLGREIW